MQWTFTHWKMRDATEGKWVWITERRDQEMLRTGKTENGKLQIEGVTAESSWQKKASTTGRW